jgi:ABC-type nickel/cobalt efflux system permease component RcnA
MTRLTITAIAVVLLLASTADAHPMGNFAVCHYARVRVHPDRVRVRYVLDLAELPTHAEKLAMDRDRDGTADANEQAAYLAAKRPELFAGLSLLADRRPVELVLVADELRFEPGAGGLPTMRIRLDAEAVLPSGGSARRFEYRDRNFPTRAGWKEIVVEAGEGVVLCDSTAASTDRSRELTTYPPDQVPPQATEARWTVAADPTAHGSAAGILPPAEAPAATPRDAFTQAVLAPELGPWVVLCGLAIAFAFGALHALAPGHGKTMVAAYLAGARGTAGHAVLLGLVVTFTHTAGVFALGAVALFATRYVMPEQLYPWLGALSGAMVCGVGGWLLYHRVRRLIRGPRPRTGTPHHHDIPDGPLTVRSLVAMGVSGGLVPCPSALVVLLAAVALHRIAYGMLLITAFSLGLAAVLVGIGLMVVYARRWIDGVSPRRGLLRGLGTVSALVITLIGIGLVAQSLRDAL